MWFLASSAALQLCFCSSGGEAEMEDDGKEPELTAEWFQSIGFQFLDMFGQIEIFCGFMSTDYGTLEIRASRLVGESFVDIMIGSYVGSGEECEYGGGVSLPVQIYTKFDFLSFMKAVGMEPMEKAVCVWPDGSERSVLIEKEDERRASIKWSEFVESDTQISVMMHEEVPLHWLKRGRV